MATTKTVRKPKTADPAQSIDPITAALVNIGRVLEGVTARLDKLESKPAATVAAVAEPAVKRGRGRPKGSTNGTKTTAATVTASGLPMPKITLTRSEAEHLVTNHWRRFADENKNYRRSVRSAIKVCEDGGFTTLAEMFAVRGVGKVNKDTGKGMPHYVAEAIAHLEADLKS